MKNDIDFNYLEEKLKGTPVPNPRIFYGREKRGSNSSFKSVMIKNILTKETVIDKDGNKSQKVKTFNANSIKYALYYIAKHGEGMTNERGESVSVNDVLKEWDESLSKDPNHSEGMHLVFSVDEDKTEKNFEALEKSVRDTMRLFFTDYRYTLDIHKHQAKPHVHVTINKHNIHTNKKITFKSMKDKKDFFHDMRENFKDNLNRYNRNFNYKNLYRVEKNLVQVMLKDELKLMTTKENFIKETQSDIKKEIRVLKDFHDQVQTTREMNFKDLKFTADKEVALKNISQTLKQDKRLERQTQRTNTKIKQKELFASSLDDLKKSDRLIDFQNHIDYFESPAQKRAMGLIQYIKFQDIKKGFEEFKFNYDQEFKNKVLIEDKDKIKFLSTRTSAWNINKQLKLIGNRKMEYAKLYNNADPVILQQLDKNYKDMIDLFKARADHIPVLIKDYETQLQYEKDPKKQKSINKSLKTLAQELKFVDKMQTHQHILDLKKQDHPKLINEFIERAAQTDEKTSAFKINKLLIEADHHKENKSLPHDLNKSFNQSVRSLHVSIEIRQMKLLKNIVDISRSTLDEQDLEKKEELQKSLEFFKKENEFIIEHYYKNDMTKTYENFNRKLIVTDEKASTYNLDKMIIEAKYYKDLRFTAQEMKDNLERAVKKLEKDITYRREKVFENIVIFERKISDEQDPQKRKELQGNLEFFRKEHGFIMKNYIKDERDLVKELVGKVENKDEKTSAFKLDQMMMEAKHHKKLKSLTPEDIKQLDQSIEKLEKSLKVRRSKLSYLVESITKKIQNEKNTEDLKKQVDSRDYLMKEHRFIMKHYKQASQQVKKDKFLER